MVCFLHLADLHLGMRVTRFSQHATDKIRQARFQALQKVRHEASRREAGYQFVLIAGDLFDDVHVGHDIARRAYEFLSSFPIPVIVLPGNHDPWQAGAVWDRDPWRQAATHPDQGRVVLLRESQPCEVVPGVTLFPCPVLRKTSTENPTLWIRDFPRGAEAGIRIGVAHGSVMDRPNLPDDDHPISPTAPRDLQLDYVALGHWHSYKAFTDESGAACMVYPGVHEPMRFSGDELSSSGWRPYSSGSQREEFMDRGPGNAVAVTIAGPSQPPQVRSIEVGYYQWIAREERLHSAEDLSRLIDSVSEFPGKELTLLRLKLIGTLPIPALSQVDDLRSVLATYVVGDLDDTELRIEPTEAEIQAVVGGGVLSTVYSRLQAQAAHGTQEDVDVAQRSLRLLYRLARDTDRAAK